MGKVSEKPYLVGDRDGLIRIHNCGFCEFSIHMDILKRKEEGKRLTYGVNSPSGCSNSRVFGLSKPRFILWLVYNIWKNK